jgi:hypothetical protein
MNPELAHDVAFASALALLDVVKQRLPRKEWRRIFDEFYRTCRATLDAYEAMQSKMLPQPSDN